MKPISEPENVKWKLKNWGTMGQSAKEALGGAVPRWFTVILMALCTVFLNRTLKQVDVSTEAIKQQATAIVVLQQNADKTSEALGKVDQIVRQLEQQLVRMEERTKVRP